MPKNRSASYPAYSGEPLFALVAEFGEIAGVIETISAEISGSGNAIKLPFVVPQKAGIDKSKKIDVTTKQDGRQVLTVHEAIMCVQNYFNSGEVLGETFLAIANQFAGRSQRSLGDIAVPIIAKCIRGKALTQANPRITEKKTVYTRKA